MGGDTAMLKHDESELRYKEFVERYPEYRTTLILDELRRTEYDYAAAAAAVLATDYPHRAEMDPAHPIEADPMLRLLESAALRG